MRVIRPGLAGMEGTYDKDQRCKLSEQVDQAQNVIVL